MGFNVFVLQKGLRMSIVLLLLFHAQQDYSEFKDQDILKSNLVK